MNRQLSHYLRKAIAVTCFCGIFGTFAADCGNNTIPAPDPSSMTDTPAAPDVPGAFELPAPSDTTDESPVNRERPRVIGATSLDNTTVVVTYDKVMGDSAVNPDNYLIGTSNYNTEAGYLAVVAGKFVDTDRTAVELTTLAQSQVQYDLAVVNVKDRVGIPMAPKPIAFDGRLDSDIVFWGSAGDGPGPDTDGDGLSDAKEQLGWVVQVTLTDGTIVEKGTVSDPEVADSDGDGLSDLQEKLRNSDPRDPDTDDDTISDYDELFVHFTSLVRQDTDADGIPDPSEINTFKTSPLLQDTDGDGLPDGEETHLATRNPLIADLPLPRIDIGDMALRLDTRFNYTDTLGQSKSTTESTETTLSQSDTQTYATSEAEVNKNVVEAGAEYSFEAKLGFKDTGQTHGFKGDLKYSYSHETTTTVSQESSKSSQQAYQDSLSTSAQVDETQSVSRSVDGASVQVLVNLLNDGDTAFNISNLELTALAQDSLDRTSFVPVATLLPATVVDGGASPQYALDPAGNRGPFVFKSTEVFPSVVEDLMRNPRGLLFKVANFDIADESGRNLAFVKQDVNDRTAGLIIDYGNGVVEKYRIATNSVFDDNAQPAGISLGYALQSIVGLSKNAPIDAIGVGPDGCAETWATGDDVQLVDPICLPVTPGGVIIEPGPNGLLDSEPAGDDIRVGNTIVDGGDGCAHTRASRDDIQVVAGDCQSAGRDGVVILAGPNGVIDTIPGGDDTPMTINGYGTEIVGRCDGNTTPSILDNGNGIADSVAMGDDVQEIPFGDPAAPGAIIISAGPNGRIDSDALMDDVQQGPGGTCGAGQCPNGACRDVEVLNRVRGVANDPAERRFWTIVTSEDFNPGVDFDDIHLNAGDVISLAYVQDRDGDGLFAREEYLYGSSDRDDNTDGCPFGDGQPGCDPTVYDFDTVRDFEEVREGWNVQVEGKPSYYVYSSPVFPDSDADGLFDDEERSLGTDPVKRDSDDDGVSDADEVRGYDVLRRDGALIRHVPEYQSAVIVATSAGTAATTAVLDDVQVIGVGAPVAPGDVVIAPGANGVIDSKPTGDEELQPTQIILDGGNGRPETTAAGDDVQVGAAPNSTRTVTVTFLDFSPGGFTCDGNDDGEYQFDFKIRKNGTDTEYAFSDQAVIDPFTTRDFGNASMDNSHSFTLSDSDQFALTMNVQERDAICDNSTGNAIVEPLSGGNGFADTQAVGDDVQVTPVGTPVMPGDIVVLPGPNGVLDAAAGTPGVCQPVIIEPQTGGNGLCNTTAMGDDVQVIQVGAMAAAGAVVVNAGPNGQLESIAGGDDEPVAGGGVCGTCAGACSGDDVMASAMPGDSCEDNGCPGGTCIPDAGISDWSPTPRTFTAAGITDGMIVEFNNGPGCYNGAVVRARLNISDGVSVVPGSVLVRAGDNGVIDSTPMGDDYFGAPHVKRYATDPLNRDTDADSLFDGVERDLNADPNNVADASHYRDDDHDGLVNYVEDTGWFIGYVDAGQLVCRNAAGEFIDVADEFNPPAGCLIVRSDKFEPDTDNDGLPDLLEMMLRSDPSKRDTDGDGLLDTDEFDPTSTFSIPLPLYRDFQDRCDASDQCNYTPVDGAFGTNIVLADTDNDGLDDREEIFDSWVITPCLLPPGGGTATQLPIEVSSNPLSADWDHDGVPDGQERLNGTDPNNPDTDGDGKVDSPSEDAQPTGCGKLVTVTFISYNVGSDNCDPGNSAEYEFTLYVNTYHDYVGFERMIGDVSNNEEIMFDSGFTTTFLLLPGEEFSITGAVSETDVGSADETWVIGDRPGTRFDFSVTDGSDLTITPANGESVFDCNSDDVLKYSISIAQP